MDPRTVTAPALSPEATRLIDAAIDDHDEHRAPREALCDYVAQLENTMILRDQIDSLMAQVSQLGAENARLRHVAKLEVAMGENLFPCPGDVTTCLCDALRN